MLPRILFVSLTLAALACHSGAPPTRAALGVGAAELLPPADLRYAFEGGQGWFDYRSDGSPRGDTVSRLLSVGMWNIEGGDVERGLRMVRAAFRLGVADSLAYKDFAEFLPIYRANEEALLLYREAARRWPRSEWPWTGQARLLERLGRNAEAMDAAVEASRRRGS